MDFKGLFSLRKGGESKREDIFSKAQPAQIKKVCWPASPTLQMSISKIFLCFFIGKGMFKDNL